MSRRNRGARIVSLDVGGFYKRLGLSDAEKRDPENWVRLVEPVVTADGETGSLLLHTRPSSRDLAPAGLDRVLWQMTVLTNDDGSARGVEWRYGPGAGIVFTKGDALPARVVADRAGWGPYRQIRTLAWTEWARDIPVGTTVDVLISRLGDRVRILVAAR